MHSVVSISQLLIDRNITAGDGSLLFSVCFQFVLICAHKKKKKKKSSQVLYALCSSCFTIGPAEDHEKWADAVNSERACADEHKRDDAVLQQPHDVLTDQHQASAGHKPKTHRRRVQPRRTATVRALKRGREPLESRVFCFAQPRVLSVTDCFSCSMLLNQPMQTLVPTSSVTSQPSQCNMGISQTM